MTEQLETGVTEKPTIKLTKAQKVFFEGFTKTTLQNLLVLQASPEYAVVVQNAAETVLATADVSALSNEIGTTFLQLIDFKALVKVDKFLKSEEYVQATVASNLVRHDLSTQIGEQLRDVAFAIEELLQAQATEKAEG